PRPPGPECPPADAIWEAVAGKRAESDVQTMLTHSLECADCSALWRLARELREASPDSAPAAADVVPPRRARPARSVAVARALAVAAAVLLVLLPRSAGHRPEPVIRGTEASALRADPATSALDRSHPVLRWSGAPPGSRYTVVVSTRDLTVLYRRSGVAES